MKRIKISFDYTDNTIVPKNITKYDVNGRILPIVIMYAAQGLHMHDIYEIMIHQYANIFEAA